MNVLMVCCYAGCKRESLLDLDVPLPTIEEIEAGIDPFKDQFMDFHVYECEGRIYCTEDCHCPWHGYECLETAKNVFSGSLCPEHFEMFAGRQYHFEDYFTNIAKTDPELFDQTVVFE